MNGDFDLGDFLVKEMKDLNKKIDGNTTDLNKNITGLKTCIQNKVDEVKKDVNEKFESHNKLHLANAKSFISTRLFIFAMIIVLGCVGTVFTYSLNNKDDITVIKTQHNIEEKVELDENRLSIENSD
jgi:hypothetical protein